MGNGPGSPMIGGILIGKTGVIGSKVLMSERPSRVASVGTNRRREFLIWVNSFSMSWGWAVDRDVTGSKFGENRRHAKCDIPMSQIRHKNPG